MLPPEIWILILRHATDIPGAFDTSYICAWDVPLRERPISAVGGPATPQHRLLLLPTKLALLRVCKFWNRIATPYLYEFVSVRNLRQVENFLHAMGRDWAKRVRHYIRRLDITMDWGTPADSPTLARKLPNLFLLFPNIEVFNVAGPFRTTDWLVPLSRYHTHALRSVCIESYQCAALGNAALLAEFLRLAPCLQILRLAMTLMHLEDHAHDHDLPPKEYTLHHPSIHTLHVHPQIFQPRCNIRWILPRCLDIGFLRDLRHDLNWTIEAPLATTRLFEDWRTRERAVWQLPDPETVICHNLTLTSTLACTEERRAV